MRFLRDKPTEPVPSRVRQWLTEDRYHNAIPYQLPNEASHEGRTKQRHLHLTEQRRIRELLKADLEAEHGLRGHPKADRLFAIAWQHGSLNLHAVVALYEDMTGLLESR